MMSTVAGVLTRRMHKMFFAILCLVALVVGPLQSVALTEMHCSRHMPCCPAGSSSQCSRVQCSEQASLKTQVDESARQQSEMSTAAIPPQSRSAQSRLRACLLDPDAVPAHPPVFRLKDDFLI
jgi:hypothetical protein